MYCEKCGKKLEENEICGCEQSEAPPVTPSVPEPPAEPAVPVPAAPAAVWQPPAAPSSDNRKLFSILAYIGWLWIFGLVLPPEKTDPRVRFNAGQGMLLSVFSLAMLVAATVCSGIIHVIFAYRLGPVSLAPVGAFFSLILWLAYLLFTIGYEVLGIVRVAVNKDKYLPVIGKYAFYK